MTDSHNTGNALINSDEETNNHLPSDQGVAESEADVKAKFQEEAEAAAADPEKWMEH